MTTMRARPGLDIRHLTEGCLLTGLSRPPRRDLVGVSRPGGGPVTYLVEGVYPDKVVVLAPGYDERNSNFVAESSRRLVHVEYPVAEGKMDTRHGRVARVFVPGEVLYEAYMSQVMAAQGVQNG